MPRRNLHILFLIFVVSFVCYHRADSAHRSRYGSMFDTFVTALGDIKDRYLYEVDERKLFEGAMDGLVEKLGDPYSGYHGESETKEFREQLGQEFGGIGVEITLDRETKILSVLSPLVGSPAYENGMMAGDKILKIGDKETKGFTTHDAMRLLRGKPGEIVKLTILHQGETEPKEIEIRRAIINVDSVLGDRRSPDGKWDYTLAADPTIGYIRIAHFGEKTIEELRKALEQCRDKHVRGLVLDMRNNPGGLLTAANEVCDQFIKQGVIVTIRERGGRERERYEATGAAPYPDLPLAVLVNGDSASASEIVAACLQDNQRAIVVGTRTFGKGTVQTPIELEGGKSLLRLTIASYWRPSEKNIHRRPDAKEDEEWGVQPSPGYEVKLDEKTELTMMQRRRDRDIVHRPGEKPPLTKPSATPSATPNATPLAVPSATASPPLPSGAPSATPSAAKPVDGKPADAKPAVEPAIDAINADPQLQKAVDALREQIAKPQAG
ncbi:MAG: PDZ domain-containing protein [Planctomycetia bacterium]|nr:PDZ domain-containing protein [Planctomycetia bacterium]